MKRLFIIASMAIMAVGCQKTTVENEVLTQIGFNTEVGKQTRAIIDGTTFTGTFGVYAYGHQAENAATKVMQNIEIANTDSKWVAKNGNKYYWPNDASTSINFYAYAPYSVSAALAEDETTMTLTNYEHTDMYLDFMVATPVLKATYADQNGTATDKDPKDQSVPVAFAHQMTQVLFKVKSTTGTGITVTLNKITLKAVTNKADYSTNFTTPTWSSKGTGSYVIFPATGETAKAVTAEGILTTAVTMIPQTLVAAAQQFEVEYKIEGTGVATETVTKTIDLLATNVPAWIPNMKVTYNLSVGLQEITFAPTVAAWSGATETGDISIN